MKNKGFTLIETVVYLALFAILMTGVLSSAYSIIETSGRNQTRAMIQEEGTFLIGKIDWALSGTKEITLPSGSGSTLSVVRFNDSVITFEHIDSTMTITRDSDPSEILDNTNVEVTGLNFIHTGASSDGLNPESLGAELTLSAKTPNGHVLSQKFYTIKYLRK